MYCGFYGTAKVFVMCFMWFLQCFNDVVCYKLYNFAGCSLLGDWWCALSNLLGCLYGVFLDVSLASLCDWWLLMSFYVVKVLQ